MQGQLYKSLESRVASVEVVYYGQLIITYFWKDPVCVMNKEYQIKLLNGINRATILSKRQGLFGRTYDMIDLMETAFKQK